MTGASSPREFDVLVVDDDSLMCREVLRALEAAQGDEFRFRIVEAHGVDAYHRFLAAHHADVLILDLKLENGEEGLDDILSFHRLHSPDTIVIVFTSFPKRDPVRTCVRAMRLGAVDCIDKRVGPSAIDDVVRSVIDELRRRTSGDVGPSSEWLKMQLPKLIAEHSGQAVAIIGANVELSAPTISELRRKLADLKLTDKAYLFVVPKTEN
jgi:ActR/RegA family two-component response regulator